MEVRHLSLRGPRDFGTILRRTCSLFPFFFFQFVILLLLMPGKLLFCDMFYIDLVNICADEVCVPFTESHLHLLKRAVLTQVVIELK